MSKKFESTIYKEARGDYIFSIVSILVLNKGHQSPGHLYVLVLYHYPLEAALTPGHAVET